MYIIKNEYYNKWHVDVLMPKTTNLTKRNLKKPFKNFTEGNYNFEPS